MENISKKSLLKQQTHIDDNGEQYQLSIPGGLSEPNKITYTLPDGVVLETGGWYEDEDGMHFDCREYHVMFEGDGSSGKYRVGYTMGGSAWSSVPHPKQAGITVSYNHSFEESDKPVPDYVQQYPLYAAATKVPK